MPKPEPAADQNLVRVVAAGTDPGEIAIREGYLKDQFPMEFPFGQGTGFSGRIESVGTGPERMNTITDFAGAQKHGAKTDGSAAAGNKETLAFMAGLVAWGKIGMPLAAVYPFERLHDAYLELAKRKANGKIVLALGANVPGPLQPPAADASA